MFVIEENQENTNINKKTTDQENDLDRIISVLDSVPDDIKEDLLSLTPLRERLQAEFSIIPTNEGFSYLVRENQITDLSIFINPNQTGIKVFYYPEIRKALLNRNYPLRRVPKKSVPKRIEPKKNIRSEDMPENSDEFKKIVDVFQKIAELDVLYSSKKMMGALQKNGYSASTNILQYNRNIKRIANISEYINPKGHINSAIYYAPQVLSLIE